MFIRLYSVGRYIDLKNVTKIFPGSPEVRVFETKDTPIIYLPKPLAMDIPITACSSDSSCKASMRVKLYEDGVISFVVRVAFTNISLDQLHQIRSLKLNTSEGSFNVHEWKEFHLKQILTEITPYIDKDLYLFDSPESEEYTAFCITDDVGDPQKYLKQNDRILAGLLIDENPNLKLHPSQIASTLKHPFSYLENDLVLYDFDRCIIINPSRDYEDILFIVELGNYQMLTLRMLDRLLDYRLDLAEDDIRKTFVQSRNPIKQLTKKLGEWLKLRYDMLFILENLENVSKIIGDFYLGNMFQHICNLFELNQWSNSIRHRMDILGDIYGMARTDVNDRLLLYMELGLSIVFITEFILLIFGIS